MLGALLIVSAACGRDASGTTPQDGGEADAHVSQPSDGGVTCVQSDGGVCLDGGSPDAGPPPPFPIFRSGFEPGTYIVQDTPNTSNADIRGIDTSYPENSDWEADLEKNTEFGSFDDFKIHYEGGNSSQRLASIEADPLDENNSVLKFWISDGYVPTGPTSDKGRIQFALADGQKGFRELHYSARLLVPASYAAIAEDENYHYTWFTIIELWNNPGWIMDADYKPFRMTVAIAKPPSITQKGIFFTIHAETREADTGWNTEVWAAENEAFAVPLGKWMTLDVYVREGDASSGRFVLKVTTHDDVAMADTTKSIFDITNYTHHPADADPDGLKDINPLKLYTGGNIIDTFREDYGVEPTVYWDDFTIYSDTRFE